MEVNKGWHLSAPSMHGFCYSCGSQSDYLFRRSSCWRWMLRTTRVIFLRFLMDLRFWSFLDGVTRVSQRDFSSMCVTYTRSWLRFHCDVSTSNMWDSKMDAATGVTSQVYIL